jgi:1,4-dihydroxy-6-naphthoate synthase
MKKLPLDSPLKIGFSPCPNDTFIFDALVNQKIDTTPFTFEYVLEDVETLNNWALEGKLPITKLSYNTFLKVAGQYALSDSGSALGKGVGPLLISRDKAPADLHLAEKINNARIAIPGINTTANLLFSLAFPDAKNKSEIIFSDIEQRVLNGEFDLGLIIHESRFTYFERGLEKWMDMGDWWERTSGAAIPLGGICIRKDIPKTSAIHIEQLIRESIAYSWQHYPELSHFVRDHAQEMEENVMRKHIDLYVNDYTTSLGTEGKKAIDILFDMAYAHGIISEKPGHLMI